MSPAKELGSAKIYEHNLLHERYVIDRHLCHMVAWFGVLFNEDYDKLPMLYWLPKLGLNIYTCINIYSINGPGSDSNL